MNNDIKLIILSLDTFRGSLFFRYNDKYDLKLFINYIYINLYDSQMSDFLALN